MKLADGQKHRDPKGNDNRPSLTDGLGSSVYNKKRKVRFGTLVKNGWFSATPDDTGISRAIRTNNPGALNISAWQRTRPGFVGQTPADAAGNITTIYRTPEQGIAAWYFLLFNRYGFGKAGQFDLASLARKYAGQDATPPRSRLTRTAGRNGRTVPCNPTPSSISLLMKSFWISPRRSSLTRRAP